MKLQALTIASCIYVTTFALSANAGQLNFIGSVTEPSCSASAFTVIESKHLLNKVLPYSYQPDCSLPISVQASSISNMNFQPSHVRSSTQAPLKEHMRVTINYL